MINCTFENGNKNSLRHVVVDGIVLDKNKSLLIKRASFLNEGGKWALIGGFVERNETLVEALKREIKEETGWSIKNAKLLEIVDSPKRRHEDRQNIAFVFTANTYKQISKHDNEVEEFGWFNFDQLPPPRKWAFDHYKIVKHYLSSNR